MSSTERAFRFAFEGRPVTWKRPSKPGGPALDANANKALEDLSMALVAARNVHRQRYGSPLPLFGDAVAVRLWFHFDTRSALGFVYLEAMRFDWLFSPTFIPPPPFWMLTGVDLVPYAKRADADNLEKLVFDAATLAQVWDDDRRVRHHESLVTQSPNARDLYRAAEAYAMRPIP